MIQKKISFLQTTEMDVCSSSGIPIIIQTFL